MTDTPTASSIVADPAPGIVPELTASYVGDIAHRFGGRGRPLISIVLFGSAATGGYAAGISDLDLLLVLADNAGPSERTIVDQEVGKLERLHGVAKSKTRPKGLARRAIQNIADKVTANVRSFFVCTRADLLSGEPGRILNLPSWQSLFVDRIAIHSIVGSGRTIWGEDLLPDILLPPVRRIDIAKAYFGLLNHALFVSATYPLLPSPTRHAMEALKRSVHSCYFCYHGQPASLVDEISYLRERYGSEPALDTLLALRSNYSESFGFTLRTLAAITRQHLRTARDARFPLRTSSTSRPASRSQL